MKLEYTDLPTMLAVAEAQARGEKIEWLSDIGSWNSWMGSNWVQNLAYRSVREVETKKMKFLGWIDNGGELRRFKEANDVVSTYYTRFPAADIEYEVEEWTTENY